MYNRGKAIPEYFNGDFMAKIFRLSDAASLALHAAAVLASDEENKHTVQEIASSLDVSANHLAKVVQRLVKAGLVVSERGPGGGIKLAKPSSEISFMQVYETMEGPLDEDYCLLKRKTCIASECILGNLVECINKEIKGFFAKNTLDQFAGTNLFAKNTTA